MKIRALTAILLIMSLLFSSCGGGGEEGGSPNEEDTGTSTWTPKPEVMKAKDGAGGIVVIIHDDGTYSTAEILNDILLRYGLVGDIAILANKVWDQNTGTVKAEEAEKWKKFLAAENENGRFKIVSHSMTHTWWGTATDDGNGGYVFSDNRTKMYDEIVGAQNALRAAFPTERVLTYAYPGFWSERQSYAVNEGGKVSEDLVKEIIYSADSRELVDQTYISARYSYSQVYPYLNDPDTVWNYVSSRQLGNGTSAAIADIYSARFSRLVVFFMHRIDHVPEDQLDSYEYPSNTMADYYMEEICKELAKDVNKGYLWNAHYEDAVLYVREATRATVSATGDEKRVEITLTDTLDNSIYNYPLTVRMMIPDEWEKASVTQNGITEIVTPKVVSGRWVLDVNIIPDGGVAVVEPIYD